MVAFDRGKPSFEIVHAAFALVPDLRVRRLLEIFPETAHSREATLLLAIEALDEGGLEERRKLLNELVERDGNLAIVVAYLSSLESNFEAIQAGARFLLGHAPTLFHSRLRALKAHEFVGSCQVLAVDELTAELDELVARWRPRSVEVQGTNDEQIIEVAWEAARLLYGAEPVVVKSKIAQMFIQHAQPLHQDLASIVVTVWAAKSCDTSEREVAITVLARLDERLAEEVRSLLRRRETAPVRAEKNISR